MSSTELTRHRESEPVGDTPVLSARDVCQHFEGRSRTGARRVVKAVDGVSFDIMPRRIVAVVGESGSGKTTLARMFALLYRPTSGELFFRGRPLPHKPRDVRSYYSEVQLVFQDPFASLNTLKPIKHIIGRPLQLHKKVTGTRSLKARVAELLDKVHLSPPEEFVDQYPTGLSGGQKQRVAIARALAVEPKVLLADEPTSMLDSSIRLDVLNLLRDLRDSEGVAIVYITHDIASARYLSDEIIVMYGGRIAEHGPTENIIGNPLHPYTKLLIASAPDPAHFKGSGRGLMSSLELEVDDSHDRPPATGIGCPFADRCPSVMERCRTQAPPNLKQEDSTVACWLYAEDVAENDGDRSP